MTIQLRGGHETTDARLDRVPQFDERSRQFAVSDDPRFSTALVSKTWPLSVRLNQQREGACPGFSRAHDLAAYPAPAKNITDDFARQLYYEARRNDEWPGEDYEGSSVLGAVKAAVKLGFVGEYRWQFSIDDVLGALCHIGPVVFGTTWLDGMFEPAPNGLLAVSGPAAGGHAYAGRSVLLPKYNRVVLVRRWPGQPERRVRIPTTEPLIGIPNSWGVEWGVYGEAFMKASDMESLLKQDGEGCITTKAFAKAA